LSKWGTSIFNKAWGFKGAWSNIHAWCIRRRWRSNKLGGVEATVQFKDSGYTRFWVRNLPRHISESCHYTRIWKSSSLPKILHLLPKKKIWLTRCKQGNWSDESLKKALTAGDMGSALSMAGCSLSFWHSKDLFEWPCQWKNKISKEWKGCNVICMRRETHCQLGATDATNWSICVNSKTQIWSCRNNTRESDTIHTWCS